MLCLLETFEKRYKECDVTINTTSATNVANLNVVIPKQHETMTSQVQKLLSYRLQRCISNTFVKNSIEFHKIVSEFILKPNIYDCWFLNGGIMQLYPDSLSNSVFLPVKENAHGSLRTCSVARALWDGEWREEVAVLTYDALYFYLPVPVSMNTTVNTIGNSKYCSKRIMVHDIVGISHVYNEESPLPGFQILRIETIGRVHYVAFHNALAKENMMIELSQQINDVGVQSNPITPPAKSKSSKDSGGNRDMDRFVLRSRQWTPSSRHVLNARVFGFDSSMMQRKAGFVTEEAPSTPTPLQQLQYAQSQSQPQTPFSPSTPTLMPLTPQNSICDLSIRLLKRIQSINLSIALSAKTRVTSPSLASASHDESMFNMGPLDFGCAHESSRNLLNCFLMEICELKSVNLQDVDFRSTDTLCFFVNIYHTLLLHARLILGRPSKQVCLVYISICIYLCMYIHISFP